MKWHSMEENTEYNQGRAFKEMIEEDLKERLRGFKIQAKYNRRKSIFQHTIVTLFGAIITILSGLNIESIEEFVRLLILVLSSIITLVGVYKTFFSNKELWISNTQTINRLKKVKSEFDYFFVGRNKDEIDLSVLENFRLKIQEILDEANGNWGVIRRKK